MRLRGNLFGAEGDATNGVLDFRKQFRSCTEHCCDSNDVVDLILNSMQPKYDSRGTREFACQSPAEHGTFSGRMKNRLLEPIFVLHISALRHALPGELLAGNAMGINIRRHGVSQYDVPAW